MGFLSSIPSGTVARSLWVSVGSLTRRSRPPADVAILPTAEDVRAAVAGLQPDLGGMGPTPKVEGSDAW